MDLALEVAVLFDSILVSCVRVKRFAPKLGLDGTAVLHGGCAFPRAGGYQRHAWVSFFASVSNTIWIGIS